MTQHSHEVHWYMEELASQVVATTGIPSDRYHLGKILLKTLKDSPDFILQIDGGTGEKETFKSGLKRTIRCASAFRNFGLKYQDVIVVMAPNHINLVIPLYASLYLGIITAAVDMTLGVNEGSNVFKRCVPKIVFCETSNAKVIEKSLNLLNMSSKIITFGESDEYVSFKKFLDEFGENINMDDFKCFRKQYPTPVQLGLVLSPCQWVTAIFQFIMGPIMKFSRVQSSSAVTQEHVYFLINKFRSDFTIINPPFLMTLLKADDCKNCDFSCFRYLMLGGSSVWNELIDLLNLVDLITNEVVCKPNTTGELRLKGPTVFKGYYNDSEATTSAYCR